MRRTEKDQSNKTLKPKSYAGQYNHKAVKSREKMGQA
jgi:hypothetical protein